MLRSRNTGLYLLVGALSVLVVLLARRVDQLDDALQHVQSELRRVQDPAADEGMAASPYALPTAQGRSVDLVVPGIPTALFFFSTSCPACAEDGIWWNDLAEEFEDAGIRFVAVSVEGLGSDVADFARDRGIEFPVVNGSESSLSDAYGIDFLPKRILVGPDGLITHADDRTDPVGTDGESFLRKRIEEMLTVDQGDAVVSADSIPAKDRT